MPIPDPPNLDPAWVERVRRLNLSARARLLFDYLVEHGSASTYEIEQQGQAHAPSAARDLRDRGVAVPTVGFVEAGGKRRGVYQLDPDGSRSKMSGRTPISKQFKEKLIARYGPTCQICGKEFLPRYLQPDHRIPQRLAGDEPDEDRVVESYMPLCGSDNRAKSYECERCPNWEAMDPDVCLTCYWAYPDNYEHIATKPERRVALVWSGQETRVYDSLLRHTRATGETVGEVIKGLVAKFIGRR